MMTNDFTNEYICISSSATHPSYSILPSPPHTVPSSHLSIQYGWGLSKGRLLPTNKNSNIYYNCLCYEYYEHDHQVTHISMSAHVIPFFACFACNPCQFGVPAIDTQVSLPSTVNVDVFSYMIWTPCQNDVFKPNLLHACMEKLLI